MQDFLFRKKFPFLIKICKAGGFSLAEGLGNIVIKKGDDLLLEKSGKEKFYCVKSKEFYEYDLFFAVVPDKNSEYNVIKLNSSLIWTDSDEEENVDYPAQPIKLQLIKLKIDPAFIVECKGVIKSLTENSDNQRGVIVYQLH